MRDDKASAADVTRLIPGDPRLAEFEMPVLPEFEYVMACDDLRDAGTPEAEIPSFDDWKVTWPPARS